VAGVAFVASIVLAVFAIYLWVQLNNTVERLDAVVSARIAETRAADEASVQRCFASAANTPALIRVLRILERQAVSPEEFEDVTNFRRVTVANAPTFRECRQLADKLGVKPRKG